MGSKVKLDYIRRFFFQCVTSDQQHQALKVTHFLPIFLLKADRPNISENFFCSQFPSPDPRSFLVVPLESLNCNINKHESNVYMKDYDYDTFEEIQHF